MGWNRIIVALPVEPLGKPAAAAAASLWNGHLREEEEEAEDGPRRPQSFRWEGKQRSSWVLSDLLANRTLSVAACFRFFCERIIRETEYGRDWNSGGPLSDRTSKPPPPSEWLYPIWTAAVSPGPLLWLPPRRSLLFWVPRRPDVHR